MEKVDQKPAITDAHVHLYDPGKFQYDWLNGQPAINGHYDNKAYDVATCHFNIKQYICIEAAAKPSEAEAEFHWLETMAALDHRLSGIVAHADLTRGEQVRMYLDRICDNPLLKGIRYALNKPYEKDPEMCLNPSFIAGVRALAGYGLSFDLVFSPDQSRQVITFVEKCQDIQLIINHTGKPPIKAGDFNPWLSYMRRLSEFPHVACKVSDILRDSGGSTEPGTIAPYFSELAQCFGMKRLMFGSDFPIVDLYGNFGTQFETLFKILVPYSAAEQHDFFCMNAERIYRLKKTKTPA